MVEIDLTPVCGSNLSWFQMRDCNRLSFCMGIENDLVLVSRSKSTRCFVSRHQNWLEFRVGIKISLISVVGRNYLIFVWGDRISLGFVWESKLTWLQCGGLNLTWFQCLDRNWLGFCVGVEKYLVLASGWKLSWFLCGGIEKHLILE